MGRIISVVSGKGGVGKTVTTINLAACLHSLSKDVLLVDADFLSPSINLYLDSSQISVSLRNVIREEAHFSDAVHRHPSGLKVIPTITTADDLKFNDYDTLKDAISNMRNYSDIIMVDAGSGLSDDAIASLESSDQAIIVSNTDVSSMQASKRILDVLTDLRMDVLGVIMNSRSSQNNKLSERQINDYLGIPVLGFIPFDKRFNHQHKLNHPFIYSKPDSRVSKSIFSIIEKISDVSE